MRSHRVHPRGRSLIGRRVVLLQDVEAQVRMPTDVDVALDVLVDSSRTAEDCCNIVEMPIPRASTRSCTSTLSMLSPSFSNITVVVHPFQPYRAAARCWCMSGIGVARLFGQHRAREWLGGYQCLLVGAAAICILVCQLSTMVLDELSHIRHESVLLCGEYASIMPTVVLTTVLRPLVGASVSALPCPHAAPQKDCVFGRPPIALTCPHLGLEWLRSAPHQILQPFERPAGPVHDDLWKPWPEEWLPWGVYWGGPAGQCGSSGGAQTSGVPEHRSYCALTPETRQGLL